MRKSIVTDFQYVAIVAFVKYCYIDSGFEPRLGKSHLRLAAYIISDISL